MSLSRSSERNEVREPEKDSLALTLLQDEVIQLTGQLTGPTNKQTNNPNVVEVCQLGNAPVGVTNEQMSGTDRSTSVEVGRPTDQAARRELLSLDLAHSLYEIVPFVFNTNQQLRDQLRQDLLSQDKAKRDAAILKAYPECVAWMEANFRDVYCGLRSSLLSLGLRCPVAMVDQNGQALSFELYDALIRSGRLKLTLNHDTNLLASGASNLAEPEVMRFRQAVDWMRAGRIQRDNVNMNERCVQLSALLAAMGFPQYKFNGDAERWQPRAERVSNLNFLVRNYAQAVISLDGMNDELKGIRDKALADLEKLGVKITWDKKTKEITNLDLTGALPTTLVATYGNDKQLQALEAWAASLRAPIRRALEVLERQKEFDPNNPHLRVGEERVASGSTFQGKPYDLKVHDFTVENTPDGKVVVKRKISYYKEWVVDAAGLTRTLVGEQTDEADGRALVFDSRHKYAAVQTQSGDVELVRAGDLASFSRWQSFYYHGGKWGGLALDVGLLWTGVGGYRLAVKEGLTAAKAINAARIIVAGSSFFAPTIRGLEYGNEILTARHYLMLLDVSGQLFSAKWRNLTAASHAAKLPAETSMIYKIGHYTLNHGQHALMGAGMLTCTPGLFANMYDRITHGAGNIPENIERGRQLQERAEGLRADAPFDLNNPQIRQGLSTVFSNYITTLFAGQRDEQLPAEVRQIKERTLALLNATPEQKAAYRQELMAYFCSAGNGNQTAVQLRNRDFATDKKPTEVQLVAAAALLFLATDQQGKTPDVLASRTIAGRKEQGSLGREDDRQLGKVSTSPHITQTLSRQDLLSFMERATVSSDSPARTLVAAELLWHYGVIKNPQLAGIYQDIVNNTNNPEELRIRALLGAPNSVSLGVLIHQIQHDELLMRTRSALERASFNEQHFGLSSQDLLLYATQRAQQETNPNVKAALLGIYCSLNQDSAGNRANHLQQLVYFWQSQPQQLAAQFYNSLKCDLEAAPFVIPVIADMQATAPSYGAVLGAGALAAAQTLTDRVREKQILAAVVLHDAGQLNQKDYNTALLRCLAETPPYLALTILERLKYDALTVEQRKQVWSLFQATATTDDNQPLKLLILQKLPELLQFQKGDVPELRTLRTQVNNDLKLVLTPNTNSQTGSNSMRWPQEFALVRAEAVRALASFGQREDAVTVRLIQARLMPPQDNGAGEGHPAVRLAALEAMNRLRPANTRQLIAHLLPDRDPVVDKRAAEIDRELAMQEPPKPEAVNNTLVTTLSNLLAGQDGRYKELGKQFIEQHFPRLLTPVVPETSQLRREVYNPNYGGSGWLFVEDVFFNAISKTNYTALALSKKAEEHTRSYLKLLDPKEEGSLIRRASRPIDQRAPTQEQLADRQKAIMALAYIIATKGERFRYSIPPEETATRNYTPTPEDRITQKAVVLTATAELIELCKPHSTCREQAKNVLVALLLNERELDPYIEKALLNGLRWLNYKGKDKDGKEIEPAIDNATAAYVVSSCLRKRFGTQNLPTLTLLPTNHPNFNALRDVQLEMIKDLQYRYQCRDEHVIGTLRALAQWTPCKVAPSKAQQLIDEQVIALAGLVRQTPPEVIPGKTQLPIAAEVRAAAAVADAYLMEGVEMHFRDAARNPDQQSSSAQRVANIQAALQDSGVNSEKAVIAIARACTGLSVDSANDPIFATLRSIVHGHPANERLQLAACRSILSIIVRQDRRLSQHDIASLQTLAYLASQAVRPAIAQEAVQVLEQFKKTNPASTALVESYTRLAKESNSGIDWALYNITNQIRFNPSLIATNGRTWHLGSDKRNLQLTFYEAKNISDALNPSIVSNVDPVETIMRACIGKPFIEESDVGDGDGRIPALIIAMQHQDKRIALAAAVMIAQHCEDPKALRVSLNTMSDLATVVNSPRLRAFACNELYKALNERAGSTDFPEDIVKRVRKNPEDSYRIQLTGNRTLEISRQNGKTYAVLSKNGLVRNVLLPSGQIRAFGWEGTPPNARLISYTSESGTVYTLDKPNSTTTKNVWKYGDNQTTVSSGDTVTADGTYIYRNSNHTDWTIEYSLSPDGVKLHKSRDGTTRTYLEGQLRSLQRRNASTSAMENYPVEWDGNTLVKIHMPDRTTFVRQRNASNGTYTTTWCRLGSDNPAEIWQNSALDGNNSTPGAGLGLEFTVTHGRVSYTVRPGTGYECQRNLDSGALVESFDGQPFRIHYGPDNEYISRWFTWEGGKCTQMTAVRHNGVRQVLTALRDRHGQLTGQVTLLNGDREQGPFTAEFSATADGDYTYETTDGYYYYERQRLSDKSVSVYKGPEDAALRYGR